MKNNYATLMKKILFCALLVIQIANFTVINSYANKINDEISEWAVTQVADAILYGIVPENLQERYLEPITRAEFASLATALYETVMNSTIEGRSTFSDTNDENVQKMAFLGVVSGVGDGTFEPDRSITREEAAVLLSNLARSVNVPLKEISSTFSDNDNISDWAIVSVGKVQNSGIMSGVGDNLFMPKNIYTIEQSIATMYRMCFDIQ